MKVKNKKKRKKEEIYNLIKLNIKLKAKLIKIEFNLE